MKNKMTAAVAALALGMLAVVPLAGAKDKLDKSVHQDGHDLDKDFKHDAKAVGKGADRDVKDVNQAVDDGVDHDAKEVDKAAKHDNAERHRIDKKIDKEAKKIF
ncbi:hypothetical protein HH299_12415 [Xanthomonas sp. Kuri4-2]